jgi:LmbE family N-acetylglucosaminyl deacetylase
MLRRLNFRAAAVLAVALVAPPAAAQLAPLDWDRGAVGLGLALRRLPVAARVLYVTAHPDDENNAVLAELARRRGVRTLLLTLTRGDGGQNAIGPELFEALGVLRGEELRALHAYDGVEQRFSRAYEFGFSFSVEETLATWGHEATLGDVVRVVRAFRPDVMLTLPLEGAGEHAHHRAAARLAREAFDAAADPRRFSEQRDLGLHPWRAARLYQGGTGGGARELPGPKAVVSTGAYDPLLGLSALELGSRARAQHKSQGASQLAADPGPGDFNFALVAGTPAPEGALDLLAGLDVTVAGLRRFIPPDAPDEAALAGLVVDLDEQARRALAEFDARAPARALPALRAGLGHARALRAQVAAAGWDDAARAEFEGRLADKEAEFEEALRRAHGVELRATPSDDLVVPGQTFEVSVQAWNRGGEALRLDELTLLAPAGWRVGSASAADLLPTWPAGEARRHVFRVGVAPDAPPSQPYWRRGDDPGRYEVTPHVDPSLPWETPPLTAVLRWLSGGLPLETRVAVVARHEGRAASREKQKDVAVVPALALRLSPALAVLPLHRPAPREFTLTVTHQASGPATARVRLEAPAGFRVTPAEQLLAFAQEGEQLAARFTLQAPAGLRAGRVELRAVAVVEGREYRSGDQVIVYDHVVERRLYREARAQVEALDVRVRPGASVVYVPGVGDAVPDALQQLGVPVTVVPASEIGTADLSRVSTVVTGVRAYTDAALRAAHPRLMAWVEAGGHLVVQYNRGEFNQAGPGSRAVMGPGLRPDAAQSPFAPFPASVTTKRVSDESSPLTLLPPSHRVFTTPNAIGPADFEGWVQERAIQLLEARDARYVELLSGADPFPENAGEKRGLLVEARVGRGTWTYVGLALFRQLAAGVPGAYRLLANLVSR